MKSKKNVLITGSSRGIGKGIATLFAKNNYNVILNCKSSTDEMVALENELKKFNFNILSYKCDVSNYADTKNMFEDIKNKFGDIDILINNAGISEFTLFTDLEQNNLYNTLNTNLNSCINCSHLALPSMISNKCGTIINISSIWGNVGASCEVMYSTSKSAINGFTKALAKEVAPSNVLVNALACGMINTDMNNNLTNEDIENFVNNIPLSRPGQPDEIAEMCLFLAEKNTYMTGQILTLDGGYL